MKFTIERDKWIRGDARGSRLRRLDDGRMCCLGFLGLGCGIPPGMLTNKGNPEEIPNAGWPEWVLLEWGGYTRDSLDTVALIEFNDRRSLSDSDRESRIAEIFAKHGVEVEFVDGAVSR